MEQKRRADGWPVGLAKVRTRIDGWRKARKKRSRMPEELWRAAAEIARRHGVNPIAEALHLNSYDLTRRVDGMEEHRPVSRPAFVEIPSPGPLAASACVVEMVRPDGAKMTIRLSPAGDGNLVPLSEAFWGKGA